jgi:hypothetical protein
MNAMPTLVGAAALVGLLTLSGCGSDDDSGSTASDQPSAGAPSGAPSGGPGGGFDPDQFQEIRDCLAAAGLDDVLPTDLPSGMPTDLPTDIPSGSPPSGAPSGFPSEGAGGPGGGLAEALSDPDVQAALEACGIELPQGPGGAPS